VEIPYSAAAICAGKLPHVGPTHVDVTDPRNVPFLRG
jgi:hypothetical protein